MKGKNLIIGGLLAVCMIASSFVGAPRSLASSATMQLSTSALEVEKGTKFTVMLTISSTDNIGNVEAFVSFDQELVKCTSAGIYGTGGKGLILISDWESGIASTRKKYAMTFKARKNGTATFAVSDQPQIFNSDTGALMSVAGSSLKVEISEEDMPKETANPQAPNTKNTNKTPKTSTNAPTVMTSPKPQGSSTPGQPPQDNNNPAKQVPTSPTPSAGPNEAKGEEKGEQQSNQSETGSMEEPGTQAEVIEKDGKLLMSGSYCIQIIDLPKDVEIPKGYIPLEIELDGNKFTGYVPESNPDNRFFLIYGENGYEEKSFYQYDRAGRTLQKYIDGKGYILEPEDGANSGTSNGLLYLAIAILSCVSILFLVLTVVLYYRVKEKETDDFSDLL
ncbi:MAG: hypothetical protein K6G65_01475 [Lachnospiraceae bacterium]|nr:hypothetical protein [Lachnospiraceae bacterium]